MSMGSRNFVLCLALGRYKSIEYGHHENMFIYLIVNIKLA